LRTNKATGVLEDRQVALKLKRKEEMKKMEEYERGDNEDGKGGGAKEQGEKKETKRED
jgi:hypothetical protein